MSYTLKTQKQKGGVQEFIASVENEEQRSDAKRLLALMKTVTGKKPELWGTSMIGFDTYTYSTYAFGAKIFFCLCWRSPYPAALPRGSL